MARNECINETLDDNSYSSLSLVLLARIATVCVPHGGSLSIVVSEIFEVIHFVERKMSSTTFENKKKSKFAKGASQGPSHRDDLLEIFGISDTVVLQANYDIDQAIAVVRRLKDVLPSDLVREELGILTSFVQQQRIRSVEELHDYIEQLFVEMLNELLIQLPNVIYKEIIECNPQYYEKVIKFSLKLLCEVESLEAFVQLSYPIGTNISDLITVLMANN
ncbi:hypothetical protein Sjap_015266 [Stephania japonica]|uniref:Uncharacterized protein n=1 Tax=Stephania japonica TaxID=461633 RepID=A0AAP0NSC3_9MAGN